jgi:hypothetical protein
VDILDTLKKISEGKEVSFTNAKAIKLDEKTLKSYENAQEKLNKEITENNNPYVKVVGEYLLNCLKENPEISEYILIKEKNIIKSLDAMRNEASKVRVNNCAVLTEKQGFNIVLKYYGISNKGGVSSEEK